MTPLGDAHPVRPSDRAAEHAGPSVLTILRDIQAGTLHPSNLAASDRQRCVEHMTAEGYSVPEIAEVLKVTERTILRDRKAIRSANALRADPSFAAETVGAFIKHAEVSIARLRRIARDRETPPAVKVDAERVGWEVACALMHTLQRLGHLPTAAQEVRGQITHRIDDEPPSFDEMAVEIARIETIAIEAGAAVPAEVADRLSKTRDVVNRLSLAESVQTLAQAVSNAENAHEQEPDDRHA